MGMPVKLSDAIVSAAREEAKRADRSITAQIEHWAKLGRAVEAQMSHPDLMALKQSEGDLQQAYADPSKRAAVHALLERIARTADRSALSESLRQRGKPLYEADDKSPDILIRVDPDGARTAGRLVNRRFVPLAEAAPARRAMIRGVGSRAAR